MFWTYKVPLFRLLVPKLSSVNFLGAASVLLSFIPKCAHSDCYTGYLLLPSHPSLPLKGQSQALILEYLVKNTFMSATVKSTLKKMHTTACSVWQSNIVSSIHQEKEMAAWREKAHIYQYHHYFWPLPFICSLSLLFCKTDHWKQIL